MLTTPAPSRQRQAPRKARRCVPIVLLVGVLTAATAGNLNLQGTLPAYTPGWAGPAGLLAASGVGGADSGMSVGAAGVGGGGSTDGDTTGGGTTAASGTGAGSSTVTGSAAASAGNGSDTAALSRVAAGLVDVDTLTDNAQLLGTGMVLRSDGLVLTNHHVIDHATQVRVRDLGDQRVYRATVVAANTPRDLALLRLQGASNLTVVAFGDSRTVKIRDPITALGNAGGGNGNPTAATGTVTALNQAVDAQGDDGTTEHLTGMIQGNAPAAPGDSGGPILDSAGVIVGVTTAGSDNSAGNGRAAGGTGAAGPPAVVDATPINVVRAWIAQATTSGLSAAFPTSGAPGRPTRRPGPGQ